MHTLDWVVLTLILAFIIFYGVWKTRKIKNSDEFLTGGKSNAWYTIGLSVMATQASAITFLSTPGQAYLDGMGFAQFYFGLPLAMVLLSVFILPLYYKSKVRTAYEYLENRFDSRTRSLTAFLFLVQRGLAAGITIYAPAIILSVLLGWSLTYTNIIIGLLVIFYTVSGGTNAVSQTQKQQMLVILIGMGVAFFIILSELPESVGLTEAIDIAGNLGKMDVVNFEFDLSNRYSIWSAFLGGTFLFMSYFGTDQSQVQRYLSGKSLRESRLGLMFNAAFKVPMQFGILLVGVLVFVFFQFNQAPLHFNPYNENLVNQSEHAQEYQNLESQYTDVYDKKKALVDRVIESESTRENDLYAEINALNDQEQSLREQAKETIAVSAQELWEDVELEDTDYVFFNFILNYLPVGIIGLLLAVILSAAMSSTASELNALATTTSVDFVQRFSKTKMTDVQILRNGKWLTLIWGFLAIAFALSASLFDNLIEAVNIIGSLFYGSILGIFLLAFFFKSVGAKAGFIALILGELTVLILFTLSKFNYIDLAYLWLNAIGAIVVSIMGIAFQKIIGNSKK